MPYLLCMETTTHTENTVTITTDITLESITGLEIVDCPYCDGTGNSDSIYGCPACDGTGSAHLEHDDYPGDDTCGVCNGEGYISSIAPNTGPYIACPSCHGAGTN